MIDTIAAEWLKIRTVRSTAYLLLTVVLTLLAGALISYLMTAEWDRSTAAIKAAFSSADSSVMVTPFTQFCFGVLGALVITSEYTHGAIRTALTAQPRRKTVLLAKVVVVGGSALVVGQAVSFLAYFTSALITGDRPAPIAVDPFDVALPTVLANGVSIGLVALVGLGLGLLFRSTAGALVTVCALMFVVPVVAMLLPAPWDYRISAVTVPYLAPQLAGIIPGAPLSQVGAGLAMVAYLVVALGAGAVALTRQDA
jgi:hypothetical protein